MKKVNVIQALTLSYLTPHISSSEALAKEDLTSSSPVLCAFSYSYLSASTLTLRSVSPLSSLFVSESFDRILTRCSIRLNTYRQQCDKQNNQADNSKNPWI